MFKNDDEAREAIMAANQMCAVLVNLSRAVDKISEDNQIIINRMFLFVETHSKKNDEAWEFHLTLKIVVKNYQK